MFDQFSADALITMSSGYPDTFNLRPPAAGVSQPGQITELQHGNDQIIVSANDQFVIGVGVDGSKGLHIGISQ
jgi:hypothetical protein